MKKIRNVILVLILMSQVLQAAPGFQSTMSLSGRTLTVSIRPNATITTGFSVIEYFIRYPSTATLSFSDPVENTAAFPNMGNITTSTGTDGAYKYVYFKYTAPNAITGTFSYTNGEIYPMFSTDLTGDVSISSLQLVHEVSEDVFYVTLASSVGADLRTTNSAGQIVSSELFYPNTSTEVLSGRVFHYFALNNVVLPLELIDFTAKVDKQTAILNWKTANERNVSHFDVEKSTNGKTWTTIGQQKAQNIHNPDRGGTEGYLFTDYKAFVPSNTAFYRLKMVDTDGTFTYSPVREVATDKGGGLQIFPNPARDFIEIQGRDAEGNWQIVDVVGKVVAKYKGNQNLDLHNFTEGVYFVKTDSGSVLRFVVGQ